MAIEVFSEAWSQVWCEELNSRPAYQETAAGWEGAVALVMNRDGSAGGEIRAVYLDLWHGVCRTARVASESDLEAARFILSGNAQAWRGVLSGKVAPVTAVMTGKIRLTKGSLGALMPYAAAARELLAAAMAMDVSFPEGW